MTEEVRWNELVNDIYDAEPEEDDESQDIREAPEEEAPEEGPPSEPDTPVEGPEDETPTEEAPEELPPEEPVEAPEPETPVKEPEEGAADDTKEPTEPPLPEGFVRNEQGEIGTAIEGQFVSFEELRRRGLRQADYTRKTQGLAETARQLEAQYQGAMGLAQEILVSENMQAFLQACPEMLPRLMRDPASTRELLQNPSKLQQFWDEYEVVKQSPALQKKLLEGSPQQVQPEIQQQAADAQLARGVLYVASGLEKAVDHVAQEYEGVEPNEVKQWVLGLVGAENLTTREDTAIAFNRLYQMFFDPATGQVANLTMIKDRFEFLKSKLPAPEPEKEGSVEEQVEEHNKQVDKALEDAKGRPPATPEGDAPAPEPEKPKEFKSWRQAMDSIWDDDD
jgi:hypothetical protein